MREYKKQSNNRFTSHKERQEETHIPFSKWTVGGRPVSEFLRKPLDRPSETIRRPPVRTYGDFIPVPPIKKSEPQKLDIDDQIFDIQKLIWEKNKARNKKMAIARIEGGIKQYEEGTKRTEEYRNEREQIQKNVESTRE